MPTAPHFSAKTFAFLRDLAKNNTREWFQENRARYEEHVKGPSLQLVSDFGPELERLSPRFVADPRPVGGSLFRIHRDTRFSKDKTPYKTAIGIQFRHEDGKGAHAPGFYLHVEPGACFAALGVWHPDPPALKKIRDQLVADPAGWKKATGGKRFRDTFALEGDALVRPPRGYDPEHPLVEDLERKDYVGVARLAQSFATEPDLPKRLAALYRAGLPLVGYLCRAVGARY